MLAAVLAVIVSNVDQPVDRHDRFPVALAMTFSAQGLFVPRVVPVMLGLEYAAGVRLRDVMLVADAHLSGGIPERGFAISAWLGVTAGWVGRGAWTVAPLVLGHLGAQLLHKEGGGQVSGGGFSPGFSLGARWLPSPDSGIGFYTSVGVLTVVPGVRSSQDAWVPAVFAIRIGSIAL